MRGRSEVQDFKKHSEKGVARMVQTALIVEKGGWGAMLVSDCLGWAVTWMGTRFILCAWG